MPRPRKYNSTEESKQAHNEGAKNRSKQRWQSGETTKGKKELVAEKQCGGCIICGEQEPCTLDFHHLDMSTKESGISHIVNSNRSMAVLQKELEKCVVLCANCHRKVHAGVVFLTLPE